MKQLAAFILKLFGWKVENRTLHPIERCVMIAAPHTSNWDFIIARLAFYVMEVPVKYTIKKEWMIFPFDVILKFLGAIPIDRSPKISGEKRKSMVNAMADLFMDRRKLAIMITPEGTRSKREKWKTGFYYIAKEAQVPIGLGFLDYRNKIAGVEKFVFPGNHLKDDLKEIMDFYKDITPRHKDKFSIDIEYQ